MRKRLVLVGILMVAVLVQGAPALAQENLQSGVQNPVRQIIAGMEQQQKRKLAILDFAKLDGSADNLTRYLTEQLATHMVIAKRNFDVIERKHLDKILAEQGLNLSGIIEPQNARQVGRLSGVDAIAAGSVTEHPTALEVTTRLIDTETGKVFAAASTRFTKDREVLALLDPEEQRKRMEGGPSHRAVADVPAARDEKNLKASALQTLKEVRERYRQSCWFCLGSTDEFTEDYIVREIGRCTMSAPGGTCKQSIDSKVMLYLMNLQRAEFLVKRKLLGEHRAKLCFNDEDVRYLNPSYPLDWRRNPGGLFCADLAAKPKEDLAKMRTTLITLSGKDLPDLK